MANPTLAIWFKVDVERSWMRKLPTRNHQIIYGGIIGDLSVVHVSNYTFFKLSTKIINLNSWIDNCGFRGIIWFPLAWFDVKLEQKRVEPSEPF